ncbi:MAG: hypothetical protein HY063_09210 [Bacteroidetes bacterium]|nr:hypothetical protein [Bacteroidota bacterium]
MTKSGADHLFLLIKSLSKGEKRFFKVWSKLYASERNNKYIRLFDAVDRQAAHNEKELSAHAYGKQFPVLKNYLYNQILKCMDQYHQSSHAEVRSLLHKVEFLCEKGLYAQCDKLLQKAKQKTEQYNMPHYSLELFRPWEKTLVFQRNDMPALKKLLSEEQKTLEQLLHTREYKILENKLYIYYLQSQGKKSEIIVKQAQKLLQNPLMKHPEKISLFEDKIDFHWIYYLFFQIKRDIPNSHLHSKKMLQHFEQHPEKLKLHVSTYLRVMNNFLLTCVQLRKHEEVPGCLTRMREVKKFIRPNTETAKTHFMRYANHSVLYFLETGKYNEGENAVKEICSELKSYHKKLNDLEKTALCLNLALFYFGLSQLHACIEWLNKIRSEVKIYMREDVEMFTSVFFILVHYEAKHYDLVLSLTKSAMRQLKEKKSRYRTETLLLEFFPTIIKTESRKEKNNYFIELKKQLIFLTDSPSEKQSFDYFDYISWAESKIENKKFAEVIHGKSKTLPVSG